MSNTLRGVLIYFIWSLPAFLYSQGGLDSLKERAAAPTGLQSRLEVLNEIIRLSINDEDSTIKYAGYLLEAARPGDPQFYSLANVYLGQAHNAKGEYETSLRYLLEALRISENLEKQYRAPVKALLGSLYGKLAEIDKMRFYFLEAIEDYADGGSRNDSIQVAILYNNLGDGYYNHSYLDSALICFDKVLTLCKLLNLTGFEKLVNGSIGMVNVKLGRFDLAEPQLKLAYQAAESNQDVLALTSYMLNLGEIYMSRGQYSEAMENFQKTLDIGHENGLKEQIRDANLKLSELYAEMGNYKLSLEHYIQHESYKDSIENLATVKAIADLRREFEVGQKQKELDLMTAQQKTERVIMVGIAILALVMVGLALVIYKYYRSKARINRELETLNQTKDKFFSIISHDLRGPVNSFMGISRMIKFLVEHKETDQLLEIANDIDHSVEWLSALLDNLLAWAMQQQGQFPNVPEKLHLREMANDLVSTLTNMARGKNIELTSSIDEDILLWADKNTTMTILRNLVNNALKFTPEGGSVTLSAVQQRDFAEIRISDTGVGIPQEKLDKLFRLQDKKSTYGTSGEKGLGLGLQLVHEFIEMDRGSIVVESEEGRGTTFKVKLALFEGVEVEA